MGSQYDMTIPPPIFKHIVNTNHTAMIAMQEVDVLFRFVPQQTSTLPIFLLVPR